MLQLVLIMRPLNGTAIALSPSRMDSRSQPVASWLLNQTLVRPAPAMSICLQVEFY